MASSPPKPSRSPKSSKSPRGRFAWLSSKDRDKKGKSPEKPQPGSDRVKKSGDDARERASAWPLEDYFKQAPMVMEEDDPEKVDPNDIDGMIKRTMQMMEDEDLIKRTSLNEKLLRLEGAKKRKDELQARWPNIALDIAQRLDWFTGLREFLVKDGDKHKLIPTIDAIVKAYKEGTLEWQPGYVTYWSHGRQITQLRVFDWAEFLHWNFKYNGKEAFWVEGLRNSRRFLKQAIVYQGRWDHPPMNEPMSIDELDDKVNTYKIPITLRLIKPLPIGSEDPDPRTNLDPKRALMFDPEYHVRVPREPLKEEWDSVGSWVIGPKKLEPKCYQSNVPPPPAKPYPHLLFWMEDDTGCDVCTIMDKDLLTLQHAAEGKNVGRKYRPHKDDENQGLRPPGGRAGARAIALGPREGGPPRPKEEVSSAATEGTGLAAEATETAASTAATGETGLEGFAGFATSTLVEAGEPAETGEPAEAEGPTDEGEPAEAGGPAEAGESAETGEPAAAGGLVMESEAVRIARNTPKDPPVYRKEPPIETQLNADMVPLLGYVSFLDSSGVIAYQPCVALEINIFAGGSLRMLKEWEIIEVAIAPDTIYPAHPVRLLGPWLRHRFYTVTAPDGTGRMYILKKWWRTGVQIPRVKVGDSGTLPGIKIVKPDDKTLIVHDYRIQESPPRVENDMNPRSFSWTKRRPQGTMPS